jgi:hypothetical protein
MQTRGCRRQALARVLVALALYGTASAASGAVAVAPIAVPTFESVGLYWSPRGAAESVECTAQYRVRGARPWRLALPLWCDARNGEYRGSIPYLRPGTTYEVRLALKGTAVSATIAVSTWSEKLPVARTVALPAGVSAETYVADQSGTPNAYVLYASPPGAHSTVDVANRSECCLRVKASYVIIRGLWLRGAAVDGIRLDGGVHDVVIEHCDISAWGRVAPDGWGVDYDAAIKGGSWRQNDLRRIIIQRNRLHHPRANCNDWKQYRVADRTYHPEGPQGIVWFDSPGNHVIRYNEIYSDEQHRFNDGLGGGANFGLVGFPGPDTDVYGNVVTNACDDALEIEGGGCNIRVWGNYLDHAYVGIASTAVTRGPLYVFRNVLGRTRLNDRENDGVLGKLGDKPPGPGRQFWFHNTSLQPGAAHGITSYGGPFTNCVSHNNILTTVLAGNKSPANVFDYDLYSGRLATYDGAEPHGRHAAPRYAPGNGAVNRSGRYALAPDSPGFDAGLRIPSFNDDYTGRAPDVGAQEAGTPPLQFGVGAYLRS